jgi:DNA-binding NarL/FixJ family response regulator
MDPPVRSEELLVRNGRVLFADVLCLQVTVRTLQCNRCKQEFRSKPDEVASRLAEHLGDDDLTERELEVLRLIRDGYRNKQIADQLVIAETTVNFHIKNLVGKLGANDRIHAVTIAVCCKSEWMGRL